MAVMAESVDFSAELSKSGNRHGLLKAKPKNGKNGAKRAGAME
jgi:hypothetical protein